MSIIVDNVRAWEADIDHITRGPLASFEHVVVGAASAAGAASLADLSSPYVERLLSIVKTLDSTASSQPILAPSRIRNLLQQSGLLEDGEASGGDKKSKSVQDETNEANESDETNEANEATEVAEKSALAAEVEWLLVSKATVQTYGVLLNTLLEQILPLHDDLWYWDDILTSYTSLSLYTVQTSPLRLWRWAQEMGQVVGESRARLAALRRRTALGTLQAGGASLSQQWQQFYGLVRQGVAARSFADLERRLLSPVARCRADARRSQHRLRKVRQLIASGLGILIDEGLRFDLDAGADVKDMTAERGRRWKGVVERSVSLMDQVTTDVLAVDAALADFEDKVFNDVQGDPILQASGQDARKPARLAQRLDRLLGQGIPHLVGSLREVVAADGRPPRLVRYWLPTAVLLLSSSTVLRLVTARRADLAQWLADGCTTVRAFWFNWVVEPIGRVLGTIRHDANSEIAIMSRDSLRADRDSLERMVVAFAQDRPGLAVEGAVVLTAADEAVIRARVHEGDVTPVLRAYERGLRRPLAGAVGGDLVRSLLIQVQKTKVDLEVAISGIDALLKSQELVFGFVGLTPGLLVSVAVLQYLRGVLSGRQGLRRGRRAGRCMRVLRNIDRLFCDASTDPATLNGILSYKHRGLLVCEVHVLRSVTQGLFPGDVNKDFLEDVDELLNAKSVDKQRQALERIRWVYAQYW